MDKSTIESDPSLLRARALLAGTIHTPEYLIGLWKLMPTCHVPNPSIEKVNPWYSGIEDLIS